MMKNNKNEKKGAQLVQVTALPEMFSCDAKIVASALINEGYFVTLHTCADKKTQILVYKEV